MLEHQVVTGPAEVVEDPLLEDEEPRADPVVDLRLLAELADHLTAGDVDHAEAGERADGRDRGDLAVGLVEVEESADVDVGQTVAVGDDEPLRVGDVPLDLPDAAPGLGRRSGVGDGHLPLRLEVLVVEHDVAGSTERDREVVVAGLVVEEVVLDELALVAGAHHEVGDPVSGEDLHDVPQNGLSADLDHRLGSELGLLAHPSAETAGEQHRLHSRSPRRWPTTRSERTWWAERGVVITDRVVLNTGRIPDSGLVEMGDP